MFLYSNLHFLPGILSTPEDLKKYIVQGEKGPTCGVCFMFSHRSKSNVQNHIESKHFPNSFSYSCHKCSRNVSTKKALEIHVNRCKEVPFWNIVKHWFFDNSISFIFIEFILSGSVTSPEDFKKYIQRDESGPHCGICLQFYNRSVTNVRNHIESKHFPNSFSYTCRKCCINVSTKVALDRHMTRCKVEEFWNKK